MQKITAIIIDDELSNIDVLTNKLQQYCPMVQLIGTADNIDAGETLIKNTNPQLVFLDIEMPKGNGFQLLQKLMPLSFNVIFITAFNQYAIQAFKFNAVDYLLKPIDPIELISAVQRVSEKIEETHFINNKLNNFFNNINNENYNKKRIALLDGDGLIFMEISEIIYITSNSNYTTLHLKNNKKKVVLKPLTEFEEILPKQIFFRIHQSHIINTNYIKKYHKGRGGFVEMEDNTKIEVAVRKKDEFLKAIT